MPLILVVLPVYAQTLWDSAATLGAVIGAFGVGAFLGTLLFGAVGRNWPKRSTFLFGFIAAPLIGYPLSPPPRLSRSSSPRLRWPVSWQDRSIR